MTLKDVVIVGAARTPVGAFLGDLKTVPVQDLGTIALQEAIKRAGIEKEDVEEVIAGHVMGMLTANNIARVNVLDAGLPETTTGVSVNRLCGSGIEAAIQAVQQLQLTDKKYIAAGGVESLSRVPFFLDESVRYQGFRLGDQKLIDGNNMGHASCSGKENPELTHMGVTAENVAERYQIPREEQDQFAYESQMKASKAQAAGRFAQEIVPVEIKDRKGNVTVVDKDGHIKPDTTLEGLAKLRPAFRFDGNGSVTAGNASGLNDGGAYAIFTTEEEADARGLDKMARVVSYAVTGLDPKVMGLGPVTAIRKALDIAGLTLEDMDIIEINEAFAAQTLGCLRELDMMPGTELYERLNPNGGAIALGHPLGMTGGRILTSVAYELKNRPEARYAVASACIGGGMGIAMILENPSFEK